MAPAEQDALFRRDAFHVIGQALDPHRDLVRRKALMEDMFDVNRIVRQTGSLLESPNERKRTSLILDRGRPCFALPHNR